MITTGACKVKEYKNINEELLRLDGYLDEDVAKKTLSKFLRNNLNFTVKLLTGGELFPFQEIMIEGMFKKDFFLAIAGRGSSKSYACAVFAYLYAIFNPGVKIGIISSGFRAAKIIFDYIETFTKSENGSLLQGCLVGEVRHTTDCFQMQLGKSTISCLPLGSGQKLRGFRFNCMILDELLLIPEKVINEVVMPFLSVQKDNINRKKIIEEEDKLIEIGALNPEERTVFSRNKFIGLSSASYTFENLFKMYENYTKKIFEENPVDEEGNPADNSVYGVMKLSWEVPPKHFYDSASIRQFQSSLSQVQFDREFNSIFTSDSGGFFSKRKMDLCTIPNGQTPTVEIKGDKNYKYILAIDPSWSKAESSDHFAMCLIKIDEKNKVGYLVHNYAVAGGQFQDHANYLFYLLKYFNIAYVIIDGSGSWFIEDCNASALFQREKMELHLFEHDFDNQNYMDGVRISKRTYNEEAKKIVHSQWFSSEWLRKSNERLAASIDHRSIKFAAAAMDANFEEMMKSDIPINSLVYNGISKDALDSGKLADFIDWQGEMINLVKSETALIEVKASDTGNLVFTLPSSIKRDNSPTRARRDSYTTLLMGNWALKCFFDMQEEDDEQGGSFIPFFVR